MHTNVHDIIFSISIFFNNSIHLLCVCFCGWKTQAQAQSQLAEQFSYTRTTHDNRLVPYKFYSLGLHSQGKNWPTSKHLFVYLFEAYLLQKLKATFPYHFGTEHIIFFLLLQDDPAGLTLTSLFTAISTSYSLALSNQLTLNPNPIIIWRIALHGWGSMSVFM